MNDGMMKKVAVNYQKEGETVVFFRIFWSCVFFPQVGIEATKTEVNFAWRLRFSWADFLQKALPEALERASSTSPQFREGLPLRALSCLGEQCLGGFGTPRDRVEPEGCVPPSLY